jgi:hypothetical protein
MDLVANHIKTSYGSRSLGAKCSQYPENRCFSCTIGFNQSKDFSFFDIKRNRRNAKLFLGFGNILDLNTHYLINKKLLSASIDAVLNISFYMDKVTCF